jgi:GT2 family glycosyltransferase
VDPGWSAADRTWRRWDRVVWVVRKRGLAGAARKAGRLLARALGRPEPGAGRDAGERYRLWIARRAPSPWAAAADRIRARRLAPRPRISLLCQASSGDAPALASSLASLRAQVYGDWELILALRDGVAPEREAALLGPAGPGGRVRIARPAAGAGPSGALARAAAAAAGDLVAVLDAGDRLPAGALLRVAAAFAADPELDLLYTDEDRLDARGRRADPFFKPDWSPELALSANYLGRLCVARRAVAAEAGAFGGDGGGGEDYDLALRVAERARRVAHVPEILCHRGGAAPPGRERGEEAALAAALARRGIGGSVEAQGAGRFRVRHALRGSPLVTVVVPTRDGVDLLRTCIAGVLGRSSYRNLEVLVVDNRSERPETLEYLRSLPAPHRVLPHPDAFNWSAINNRAAREARGDHLIFLNNDTEVVSPDWVEAMLGHAQQDGVGAVGARLLYPDGTVQHAGVVVGIGGFADHAFRHFPAAEPGHGNLALLARNCSAVTGACMMVPRAVFERMGGFDERFGVAFNDVDFCLRLGEAGLRVVYTPHAVLFHHESASRGPLHPRSEYVRIRRRWGRVLARGDPYYNPNLTIDRLDYGVDL